MKFLDIDGLGPVSRVGLGTWQFGSREWGYGEDYASGAAADIVARALELGVTLFDTAEAYGTGRSERILGKALKDRARGADRDSAVVATKLFPIAPFPPVVRARAQASARRLGLDTIPLYQIHQANPLIPDSVIMPGMQTLLEQQTIAAVGVSNYSLRRWRAADAALGRPVVSNQVQFSLAKPGPLRDLVPFAQRENRMIMAWSPLAQGLLGGKYGPDHRPGGVRAMNPLFGTENLKRIGPLLDVVRSLATRYDAEPAQIALAWLLAQPQVVVIPGASSVEQLEFNVAAADLDLDPDAVSALTAAAESFTPVSAGQTLADAARSRIDGTVKTVLAAGKTKNEHRKR